MTDYLPSYIELNGLRLPFKLFESCESDKNLDNQYFEETLINK